MKGIFLDLETNGLNIKYHHVLEIAIKIVDLYSGEQLDEFQAIICMSYEEWQKSNPESLKICRFSWNDIRKGKELTEVRSEIFDVFHRNQIQRKKSVFVCQNPSFDRMFFSKIIDSDLQNKLQWPYHWLDLASMHWAVQMCIVRNQGVFPWQIGLSKDEIAAWHNIEPENPVHRAMNGVDHLIACYEVVVGFPAKSH